MNERIAMRQRDGTKIRYTQALAGEVVESQNQLILAEFALLLGSKLPVLASEMHLTMGLQNKAVAAWRHVKTKISEMRANPNNPATGTSISRGEIFSSSRETQQLSDQTHSSQQSRPAQPPVASPASQEVGLVASSLEAAQTGVLPVAVAAEGPPFPKESHQQTGEHRIFTSSSGSYTVYDILMYSDSLHPDLNPTRGLSASAHRNMMGTPSAFRAREGYSMSRRREAPGVRVCILCSQV